jgi:hypothetical protein
MQACKPNPVALLTQQLGRRGRVPWPVRRPIPQGRIAAWLESASTLWRWHRDSIAARVRGHDSISHHGAVW